MRESLTLQVYSSNGIGQLEPVLDSHDATVS